jgi:hypothetical protein
MPPKGWRKRDYPTPSKPIVPLTEEEKELVAAEDAEAKKTEEEFFGPEQGSSTDSGPVAVNTFDNLFKRPVARIPGMKGLDRILGKKVEPDSEPEGTAETSEDAETPSPPVSDDDEEADFVTERDVKPTLLGTAAAAPKYTPGDSRSYVGGAITAMGVKLHEVEYSMTGHPIFIHTPADERLWDNFGQALAHELPPKFKGAVLAAVMVVASEGLKFGLYASDRSKKVVKDRTPGGKPKRK